MRELLRNDAGTTESEMFARRRRIEEWLGQQRRQLAELNTMERRAATIRDPKDRRVAEVMVAVREVDEKESFVTLRRVVSKHNRRCHLLGFPLAIIKDLSPIAIAGGARRAPAPEPAAVRRPKPTTPKKVVMDRADQVAAFLAGRR